MKKGLVLFVIIVLSVFLIACAPTPKVMEGKTAPALEKSADANTVKITASGFEPKTLTVKTGTIVTFVNEDSNKHWPASATHPTHKVYPGSGIEKCGIVGETNIFDACRGLAQGESFSFTFNEKGSWKYHDHLNVPSTGTIVVE